MLVRWSDVVVRHTGLADPDARRRKAERYLRMSLLTLAEYAGDPFVLFNLGAALLRLDRPAEAAGYLGRSLAAGPEAATRPEASPGWLSATAG